MGRGARDLGALGYCRLSTDGERREAPTALEVVGVRVAGERVRCGSEVFHALRAILKAKGFSVGVGDEGGFSPKLKRNAQAFELMAAAVRKARYRLGQDVAFAADPAASEFYDPKKKTYVLKTDGRRLDAKGMVAMWKRLADAYPLISLEDGCAEDDWDGWKMLTSALGKRLTLVGDDLFVTNVERLRRGLREGVANAILIKVNQIGTLTETFAAIELAKRAGYGTVLSHRSGETEDTTIADIAVGTNALQIKTGSLSRSDRVAKYNQLLRIEEDLGDSVDYPGREAFARSA